jgi:hypothetical protein
MDRGAGIGAGCVRRRWRVVWRFRVRDIVEWFRQFDFLRQQFGGLDFVE